jgi:glutaredoxin 3
MNSLVQDKLSKFITPGKVFIFSKSYCPYCDDAKQMLKDLEIEFGSIEMDSEKDQEFLNYLHNHSGFKTYPKIYIGNKCIGGFSDMNKLFNNNKLFALLKQEGISYKF